MKPETISAVAASAAASIAVVALVVSIVGYRKQVDGLKGQHLAFLTVIRQEWEQLRNDWATTVLLWNPGFWYYSDAQAEERSRISAIQTRAVLTPSFDVDELRSESQHVRRVARFFAYVADALLQGRLTVGEAYTVFGPEVVRLRPAVVWLAGAGREAPTAMGDPIATPWDIPSNEIPSSSYYSEQSDIVALIDLLSAEMARLGDTHAHYLLMRAEELSLPGRADWIRKNIAAAISRRRNGHYAKKLRRHARFAEKVPLSAIAHDPDPLLSPQWSEFIRPILLSQRIARRKYAQLRKARGLD